LVNFTPADAINYATVTTTAVINVLRANQTITFGPLPGRTFVDPPFDVTATASSGLAVSFSSAGACSVSGSAVRITGGGKCTITASQPGNNNYNPATPVSQTFSIACFPPQRMPFGIPGGPGTAQMTQLGIKEQLPAEGGGLYRQLPSSNGRWWNGHCRNRHSHRQYDPGRLSRATCAEP
jgi:hypothetical protein